MSWRIGHVSESGTSAEIEDENGDIVAEVFPRELQALICALPELVAVARAADDIFEAHKPGAPLMRAMASLDAACPGWKTKETT